MKEYAIVGSGIGGSSIAAYLNAKGHDIVLFEKESYLGGCSSSFYHKKHYYNTGATTFAGYQNGFVLKEIFDAIGFHSPKLRRSDPAIVVVQNGKTTPRYQDLEMFLSILQENYPHSKHHQFWQLVYKINKTFYKTEGYYYSNKNIFAKLRSLASYFPLGKEFFPYIKADALSFIKSFYGLLDEEYLHFLEAQVLIVAQAPLKEINFFTAALALAYTFNDNYYVEGGFSTLFNELTQDIHDLYRSTEVQSITKKRDSYELDTSKGVFQAKNIILNSTVYGSAKLFTQKQIQNYYKKYELLNNYQSSFMLYFTLKSEREFFHHYQIIEKEIFAHTISRAIFVSFSDQNDTLISQKGEYSVTVSIHTDLRLWQNKTAYKEQKEQLKNLLLDTIKKHLSLDDEQIISSFAATPNTFSRYIKRAQLGGNAMSIKNFLPKLPSNDTPIDGLYHVGDSVYAAQGWPGVMMGVKNLTKLLDV